MNWWPKQVYLSGVTNINITRVEVILFVIRLKFSNCSVKFTAHDKYSSKKGKSLILLEPSLWTNPNKKSIKERIPTVCHWGLLLLLC